MADDAPPKVGDEVPGVGLLTPDFYGYDWQAPSRVGIDGEFAVIEWSDGLRLRAHGWWLRENLVEEGTIDAVTREGTLDPAELHPDLHLTSVEIAADGAVDCRWGPEPKSGRLHPGWLRHVAEAGHRVRAGLPESEIWEAGSLAEIPSWPGGEALSNDGVLREWLRTAARFGVARLVDLPCSEETTEAVASRIGPVRESNFGAFWSVRVEDDPTSTAYGHRRLAPHTDLPTRELPPGFQVLHCLENSCEGGESLLADGRALVNHLAEHERDVLDALTSLNWIFFNRSRDDDHRWSGPIVDHGGPSSPMSIRGFYPLRAFPDMPDLEVPRAYRAVRRFHELAADPRFQIRYRMRPGDLVIMDNRRILHGREAFEAEGRRHFRGFYIDQDEVYSRLRVLERRRSPAALG